MGMITNSNTTLVKVKSQWIKNIAIEIKFKYNTC